MSDYPEHDKLALISDKSQAIGEFINWLKNRQGIEFCHYNSHEELEPVWKGTNQWLAEYFGIDQDKLDEEKDTMLKEIRNNINR